MKVLSHNGNLFRQNELIDHEFSRDVKSKRR